LDYCDAHIGEPAEKAEKGGRPRDGRAGAASFARGRLGGRICRFENDSCGCQFFCQGKSPIRQKFVANSIVTSARPRLCGLMDE